MKVSFQALSRHLDLAGITAERVAEVLPMLGLEVESVTTFGLAPLPLVVVGEIKSFENTRRPIVSVSARSTRARARSARSSAAPRTSRRETACRSRSRAR
jgi:hypothetical protein